MFKKKTSANFAREIAVNVVSDFLEGLITDLPGKLISFTSDQLTVTLTLSTGQYSNEPNFYAFMQWFFKHPASKKIRNIVLDYYRDEDWNRLTALGPANGKYYFWHKGRLFWFNRETHKMPNETQNTVMISTYGRDQKPLLDLLAEFQVKESRGERIYSYSWKGDGWSNQTKVAPRPLDTIAIDKAVLNKIISAIDEFKAGREWYVQTGIPYKLVIMLYGPPGTGKTSLTRALATHYKSNINRLSPSGLSEEQLFMAISSVQPGDILFMDDFNANGDFCIRRGMEGEAQRLKAKRESDTDAEDAREAEKLGGTLVIPAMRQLSPEGEGGGKDSTIESLLKSYSLGSLQGFLQAIDGVVPLDDVVVIMTTNTIDQVDPACLRWGRVDVTVEIPHLHHHAIVDYIARIWPDKIIPDVVFSDIPGCDLAQALSENRHDFDAFIASLPKA